MIIIKNVCLNGKILDDIINLLNSKLTKLKDSGNILNKITSFIKT